MGEAEDIKEKERSAAGGGEDKKKNMAEGKKHFMSELLVAPHLQIRLLRTDRLMIGTRSPGRPWPGGEKRRKKGGG